jgi:hypothetical protein
LVAFNVVTPFSDKLVDFNVVTPFSDELTDFNVVTPTSDIFEKEPVDTLIIVVLSYHFTLSFCRCCGSSPPIFHAKHH